MDRITDQYSFQKISNHNVFRLNDKHYDLQSDQRFERYRQRSESMEKHYEMMRVSTTFVGTQVVFTCSWHEVSQLEL